MNGKLDFKNKHLLAFKNDLFSIDVLGGVDCNNLERLICTLRVSYQNFPPQRTTIDLYSENQINKLLRKLCDSWSLRLLEVSNSIQDLILKLENYRLSRLSYPALKEQVRELSSEETKIARQALKKKTVLKHITKQLNTIGLIGEDENAIILFLALASHKFSNPFSVLCLAKSGIGKSYMLQTLSECLPKTSFSFHTQISANALYYFNSSDIQNKALLIEDLEWTTAMLSPLATLQSQGRLVKTRATKDKDGMLHSTTFEVKGNLCLVACAYSDKLPEVANLPFLCIHLNHSHNQDVKIMDYQRKASAGLIKTEEVAQAKIELQNLVSMLQNVKIVNDFAPLIELPKDVKHPRKSLLLLLNFIDVITYFFQFQREQHVDKSTGEVVVKTHPDDIELAFTYLKPHLFRRADELSTSARGFFHWLTAFLATAKTNEFTAFDVRKTRSVHPRTLNNYLNELKLFNYIQIIGGNKHREGFRYKITPLNDQSNINQAIENELNTTLKKIKKAYQDKVSTNTKLDNMPAEALRSKPVGKTAVSDPKPQ